MSTSKYSYSKHRPFSRKTVCWLGVLAITVGGAIRTQAQNTYTYSGSGGGAWLNSTSWSGGPTNTFPGVDLNNSTTADGAATDIAQFNTTTGVTNVGINFASTTNSGVGNSGHANGQLTLAGIGFGGSSSGLTLGSSSSNGILVLNGATFGTVTNAILNNTSTGLLTIANVNSGSASLTMALALGNTNSVIQTTGTGGVTISSSITGTGKNLTFQATNTGQLTLSGANTFSGTFTASSGTTTLGAAGALGGVSGVSVASGAAIITTLGLSGSIKSTAAINLNGTLDLSSDTETVASLAGTSATASLVIGKSGTTAGTLTVGDSTNTSFAGVISGSPVNAGTTILTKQGSGTLTLTNANTYTGKTTISGGSLLVTNASGSGTGTGAVAVNAGTLGGTGSTSGAVTVASGATLQGGAGTVAGSLTLTTTPTLNAGSILQLTLDSSLNHSTLALPTGSNPFNSNQAFNFTGTAVNGFYDNIITGVAANITTTGWTINNGFNSFSFTDDGSNIDLMITDVPEPATILGGLLMVGLLGWNQRRRLTGLAGMMCQTLSA